MAIAMLAFVLFLFLKLTGVITWSWVIVLMPLWAFQAVVVVSYLAIFVKCTFFHDRQ